jgi:hypothetical protein
MDAFAALVPAEVLTLHALIISATTEIKEGVAATATEKAGPVASTILPGAEQTLFWSFWGLVAMSAALYVVPRYTGGKWDKFDWIRVSIAPLAFVGWTMLQRTTAFDAVSTLHQPPRTVIALFLGAVLGATTAALALKADKKQ